MTLLFTCCSVGLVEARKHAGLFAYEWPAGMLQLTSALLDGMQAMHVKCSSLLIRHKRHMWISH